MEAVHLDHREVATHVSVEDKEATRGTTQDLVTKMVDASRRSQGTVLLEIPVQNGKEYQDGLMKLNAKILALQLVRQCN